MGLTAEQKAASQGLQAAIEEMLRAYEYDVDSDTGTVAMATDWVVAVAQQGYSDDGEQVGGVCVLMPDGEIPAYRALGLLECARAGIESQHEFRGHEG
jgi:hypothetical protein